MGKRSNFERIPQELYPTPYEAVKPLIRHLGDVRFFAEPCAGKGDLVRHLESFGKICQYASDIEYGHDALDRHDYGSIDAIITNPPYLQKLMMPLINHFMWIAPTWLLLRLDFAANAYMAPFLPYCSDIVVLPRLIWIPGTDKPSKENAAWFRFSDRIGSGPAVRNHKTPRKTDLRPNRIARLMRARERRHVPSP